MTSFLISAGLVLLLLGAVALVKACGGSRVVRVDTPLPKDFPAQGFSHAVFESLLQEYVDDEGRVAYQLWHDNAGDMARLDSYLAALARYSPLNAQERFPAQSARLAYWLNAYNASVIKGVLLHWPLHSVNDVKARLQLKQGQGFFHELGFVLGQKTYSLLQIENEQIRKPFQDARIHFVLNCASGSCPTLQPELPKGPELETYLADAAGRFVSDPSNVRVDPEARKVYLSAIFDWYADDFLNDLRRRGKPAPDLIAYVRDVAPPALQAQLEGAQEYEVVFLDYDWSVNGLGDGP